MAKSHVAVGLAAWALLLVSADVSAAALEKYQTFQQLSPREAPRQFAVPERSPVKKDDWPAATGLFASFEAQVKSLPPEERRKLLNTMLEKQRTAYIDGHDAKGNYYGQLVEIIVRNLDTGTQ